MDAPQTQNNFFVLTGAPGGGKTTLVCHLRGLGVRCVDEPARAILADQRARNGLGTPDHNKLLFTELLLSHSIENFSNSKQFTGSIVFDRSVVDSIAYASLFELPTKQFEVAALKYRYNKTVFVLAPWEEIYATDDERKMSFEDSVVFHRLIISAYERLGYQLIEIPRGTVESRSLFLSEKIAVI